MSSADFASLLARVRTGDQNAAAQLIHDYEPHIRRVLRERLTSSALRRQFDSLDVCQSVLGRFFVRAGLGEFDLDSPAQLIGLLAKMAENRLLHYVEKAQAGKRDIRRTEFQVEAEWGLAGKDPTPSQVVAGRELLERAKSLLPPDMMRVAEARAAGTTWEELASERSMTPDALRIRFRRAVDRVATDLGLSDDQA